MKMRIVDDVLTLRSQFGGIWTLLHLSAILVFVFPYVWFLIKQWTVASFGMHAKTESSMPLWMALAGFVWTGGGNWKANWQDWHFAPLSFGSFAVFALYNAARLALLWKTKNLETQEEIIGLPAEFSLQASPTWRSIYYATQIGFWAALCAAIINTIHFFTMRVPI
jgi:hypothetical protein